MGIEDQFQAVMAIVQRNAIWAAPIMFALAFAESLAFISLLIPAWAALVAIGAIVASQGFHIIIPVWIAASIGAALRRLAVLLDRSQARASRAAHMAAVAPPDAHSTRRAVREKVGRARHFHRPLFRAAARLGAARGRHFRNAVLALSSRQLRIGFFMGSGTASGWRRHHADGRPFLAIRKRAGLSSPGAFMTRPITSARRRRPARPDGPAARWPPLTPIAPTTLPPITIGIPPRDRRSAGQAKQIGFAAGETIHEGLGRRAKRRGRLGLFLRDGDRRDRGEIGLLQIDEITGRCRPRR